MEVINNFYNISIGLDEIPVALEGMISPAEVLESLCTYFKSYTAAIEHMCDKVKKMPVPLHMTQSVILPSIPDIQNDAIEESDDHLSISEQENDSELDKESDSEIDSDYNNPNHPMDDYSKLLSKMSKNKSDKESNADYFNEKNHPVDEYSKLLSKMSKNKKKILKINKQDNIDITPHEITLKGSYKPSKGTLLEDIFNASDLTQSGGPSILDELYSSKITSM
jgi:hypothetical protein